MPRKRTAATTDAPVVTSNALTVPVDVEQLDEYTPTGETGYDALAGVGQPWIEEDTVPQPAKRARKPRAPKSAPVVALTPELVESIRTELVEQLGDASTPAPEPARKARGPWWVGTKGAPIADARDEQWTAELQQLEQCTTELVLSETVDPDALDALLDGVPSLEQLERAAAAPADDDDDDDAWAALQADRDALDDQPDDDGALFQALQIAAAAEQIAPDLYPEPLGPELPQTGAREDADALAVRLGEAPGTFRLANVDWAALAAEGVLITLHHSRWRAKMSLDLEDVGIYPANDEERRQLVRFFNPGTRNLLPSEVLKAAQTATDACRYNLTRHGFKSQWGEAGTRFVHESRYASWKARALELQAEYVALGQALVEQWPTLMEEAIKAYSSMALQAYQGLQRSPLVTSGRYELPELPVYVRQTVERMMAKMPTAQEAADSYRHWWDLDVVPLQAQVAVDQARADETYTLARERARAQAESELQLDLRRQEMERARDGLQKFVADVQATIREELYDVALNALEGIREGEGKLAGNSTRSLRTVVQFVDQMVFWDDEGLKRQMAQLDRLAAAKPKERDGAALTSLVRQLGAESRLVLTELGRTPERSGAGAGIPDELPQLVELVDTFQRGADLDVETLELPQLDDVPSVDARGGDVDAEQLVVALA
jgi:hypothetical protein